MFCGNCGTQIDDGAMFCPHCGAAVGANAAGTPGMPTFKAPKTTNFSSTKKIFSFLPALVSVVVIILLLFLFGPLGGRSAEKTVDELFTAVQEADLQKVMDLMPPGMVEAALEEQGMSKSDMEEELDSLERQLSTSLSFIDSLAGEGWSMKTETLSAEVIKGDSLADIKDEYKEYDVKVSEAKTISVRLSILGADGDEIQSTNTDIGVVKVGKSWYIDVNALGSIF